MEESQNAGATICGPYESERAVPLVQFRVIAALSTTDLLSPNM
jgi:hypothetical protein